MIVVVAGTGTGIGKTHVGTAVVRHLAALGVKVAGRKPIESGVDGGAATDFEALSSAGTVPMPSPPPYLLRDPVSPHLAARQAGVRIEIATAATWCHEASPGAEHLLVETAGGLFSPLSASATNHDLVRALEPDRVVLVVPDRLGVLHDVRAALLAAADVVDPVVVLVAPETPDASTGSNEGELRTLGWARHVVGWPRGAGAVDAARLWSVLASRGEPRVT